MSYEKRRARLGEWCVLGLVFNLSSCGDSGETKPGGVESESEFVAAPSRHEPGATPAPARFARPGLARTTVRLPQAGAQRLSAVAATGRTPLEATESFRKRSQTLLGLAGEDLKLARLERRGASPWPADAGEPGVGLMFDRKTGKHKFRLYNYEQRRDGVPVFRAGLRTLVRADADNPVVWASSNVRAIGAFRPKAPHALPSVDLERSLRAARGSVIARGGLPPTGLTQVTAPEPVIFAGIGERTVAPRSAMTYTAQDASGAGKWTFVADAETGEVLHVESALHFDVYGTVAAEVTANTSSMACGDVDVRALPYVEVTSGSTSAFTDAAGAFMVAGSNGASVDVTAGVSGQFFDVFNDGGSTFSSTLAVVPPGPAEFLFEDNTSPPELTLAQLNAYKHANDIRDMLLTYVPDYPIIAGQTNFPIHVNRNEFLCETTGGAWYDDDSSVRSLNFCQQTAERANTAFGSIIHHEYGHHIIDSGGSQQNEYGEGMSDTIAMLFAKDPAIGVGYRLDCAEPLRVASSTCQYSATECSSCGSGLYECGALISGTVWDIWQEFEAAEPTEADDLIRSLVLSSIPLHTGSSIDASIAVDLLTLDDDDGLLENGTPHYEQICTGFALHGMDCPPIVGGLVVKGDDLAAEGPSGGPFGPTQVTYTLYNLGPEPTLQYAVDNPSNALWLGIDQNGGTIAVGDQTTVTVSIDQNVAASLPDGDYTAGIHFLNETSGVGSVVREQKLRVGAPEPVYTASFAGGFDGFTVGSEYGNLWHVATTCVDALPGHSSGGALYYGKPDLCNYTTPVPIEHTVTSPVIALTTPEMAELGFNYLLDTENDPNYDSAFVSISVNGGPFTVVASNNRGGVPLSETRSWKAARFGISDLLPPGPSNIQVQVAFNAGDPSSNTKTGFAIDDLVVFAKIEACTNDAECDDGLYCNGAELCVNQVCSSGTVVTCNDGVECTTDSCDEDNDVCVNDPGPECGADHVFVEVNGSVVLEAEHFAANTARASHQWSAQSNPQASGQSVMVANPNSGQFINSNYAVDSPELTYRVQFSNAGTYYVWIRGVGASGNDDSCHVGIDGNEVGSADRVTGFTSSLGWTRTTMDGPVATLQVNAAGIHEINLWMREDGFVADKIVLTKSSSFVPSGSGPQESPRAGGSQGNPCDEVCAEPTVFTTSSYTSPNLGTAARCFETEAPLTGGVCGNFVNPKRLFVNGVEMTCNWSQWPLIPPPRNGGYCIEATSGNQAWASFTTW